MRKNIKIKYAFAFSFKLIVSSNFFGGEGWGGDEGDHCMFF